MNTGHAFFMERALALASLGKGHVSPNPCVGAVIVKNGKIIAEGYHPYFGGPHAETVALQKAGKKAIGATLYVTLEPCTHWGKTPPCAPAVIKSGISSVVIAMKDPNPKVNGRGLAALKQTGIHAQTGVLEAAARDLNRPYLTARLLHRPYVILKMATTLDGKIATEKGESKWISNPESRQWAHRLRAESDAIMVGRRTVELDNPELTSHGQGKDPLRVIIDPELKSRPSAKVFNGKKPGAIIITSTKTSPSKAKSFQKKGIQILRQSLKFNKFKPKEILTNLFKINVNQVLIEGGSETAWNFLQADLIDEVYLFISPKLIGGAKAIPSIGGAGLPLHRAVRIKNYSISRIQDDLLLHGYIHTTPLVK